MADMVIQLADTDANRLLWLVQNQAAIGPIWQEYWADMANTINQQLDLQRRGGFFQCSACKEPEAVIDKMSGHFVIAIEAENR